MAPKEFYDTMALHYDSFIEQTRLNYFTLEEERIFLESIIGDKKILLDLGCGTGRTMKLLSTSTREIVGIDISVKMVELAQKFSLSVVQGSALALPFAQCSFDAIYSIHMGFGYCTSRSEMRRLASELFRVLKQGGMAILDTPHGQYRGNRYITSWTAGDTVIKAFGYGKNRSEIYAIMKNVGFLQLRFLGSYSEDAELRNDSRRLIVIAVKD